MDVNGHEERERMEPGELLEDRWFFDNLLNMKPRMLRSMSDPCTSSKSYEETYASIKKSLKLGNRIRQPITITKAPSEGSGLERRGGNLARKAGTVSNCRKLPAKGLHRVPSLPATLHRESEDFYDEDTEFSMGRLIRQASMHRSDSLPPRQQSGANKVSTPNSVHRSRRKSDLESAKLEGLEEMKSKTHKLKTQKSFIEYEEPQGFKEFRLNASSGVINNETMTRSYFPEAPKDQSLTPSMPQWSGNGEGNGKGKKSSNEDMMKAQIKFWARVVASHVRQEC